MYFDEKELKRLYKPAKDSHKGQNGKLTIIGGSKLFHGASLWALKVASRIVDMVFYSSVPENNQLTEYLKGNLYDFIAVRREDVEEYILQSGAILLGPGLPREAGRHEDEESTGDLTRRLLKKFPEKTWIIDAGSLTEMDPGWLKDLKSKAILTPHRGEFTTLFNLPATAENCLNASSQFNCIILLKGVEDIVCNGETCVRIKGGNEGMTKGGTGDVLSGLVAALSCKNDPFLASQAASFFNKKAGDSLYKRVGPYFNASDLCDEIPKIMAGYER